MNISDFSQFVLTKVKGCPDPVALFEIRNAIIELCRRALVWVETQAPITSVVDQKEYAYTPDTDQQVVKLLDLTVNGWERRVIAPDMAERYLHCQSSECFAFGGMASFTISPAVAAGLPIVTRCAVAPTIAATTVPDKLQRFAEQIGRGAIARIASTPGRDFSNMTIAQAAGARWEADIAMARAEAFKGFARSGPSRVAAAWF